MTEVNFLWGGDRFNFLQNLVIKSHSKVGHTPVIWISGSKPKGNYWNEIENTIVEKNADSVYNIEKFLSDGGNYRTAADLWRWHFLYEKGGIWCDSDLIALKHFPNDEWIVCTGEERPNLLSIAILKVPEHQKIFLDCIKNIKKEWGNVEIFSKAYQKFFGNLNSTHQDELFYPYKWKRCDKLIKKGKIPKNCYSIHYWAKAVEDYLVRPETGVLSKFKQKNFPSNIDDFNEDWCKKNPKTMLGRLFSWLNE